MEEFWSLFPILMVVAIEVVLSRWIHCLSIATLFRFMLLPLLYPAA